MVHWVFEFPTGVSKISDSFPLKSTSSKEILISCEIKNEEPTKIGHFLFSESILEVKNQLNLPENDFLLRNVN